MNATVRAGVLAFAALLLAAADGARAQTPQDPACGVWTMRTVASGLGSLENLEPDGRGGMLVSATSSNAVVRVMPDGRSSVLIPGVSAPGGLRVRGSILFFNTGDAAASGALNRADGTIDRFDLATGKRSPYATGLTMPNGLAFLPSGDAVVSRSVGSATGITRIPVADPSKPQFRWAALDESNGLAVDPTGTWLYAGETFTAESEVFRIRIGDPKVIESVARLGAAGVPKGLDDMTIDGDGVLYITANGSGEVIRLDPRNGRSCVIARGLRNPSAVKFGKGTGWPASKLYVSGFDGALQELTPPAGVNPPPAKDFDQAPPGPTPQPGRPQPQPQGQPAPTPGPRIRLAAAPRRVATGRRTCVRFTARAAGRPVSGARIRFAGRRAVTSRGGRARICLRFRVAMTHRARVTAPGHVPDSVRIVARRR